MNDELELLILSWNAKFRECFLSIWTSDAKEKVIVHSASRIIAQTIRQGSAWCETFLSFISCMMEQQPLWEADVPKEKCCILLVHLLYKINYQYMDKVSVSQMGVHDT